MQGKTANSRSRGKMLPASDNTEAKFAPDIRPHPKCLPVEKQHQQPLPSLNRPRSASPQYVAYACRGEAPFSAVCRQHHTQCHLKALSHKQDWPGRMPVACQTVWSNRIFKFDPAMSALLPYSPRHRNCSVPQLNRGETVNFRSRIGGASPNLWVSLEDRWPISRRRVGRVPDILGLLSAIDDGSPCPFPCVPALGNGLCLPQINQRPERKTQRL